MCLTWPRSESLDVQKLSVLARRSKEVRWICTIPAGFTTMAVSSVYVVVALWLLRTTVLEVMEDSIDDIIPVVNLRDSEMLHYVVEWVQSREALVNP
jgi:hypothetical protein